MCRHEEVTMRQHGFGLIKLYRTFHSTFISVSGISCNPIHCVEGLYMESLSLVCIWLFLMRLSGIVNHYGDDH